MQIITMHVLQAEIVQYTIFTYYAGIMLDAFSTYYAQNYAGIIGAGLLKEEILHNKYDEYKHH